MGLPLSYPVIIDGGQATVLEELGCNLNHKLWSAKIIGEDPDKIIEVHKRYILAGAKIIATASYQASIPGLMEFGLSKEEAKATLIKTVELAKRAIAEIKQTFPGINTPLIGASMGPYGAYLADGSEYRGHYNNSKQGLADFHLERIQVLHDTAADLMVFETFPDIIELNVLSEILLSFTKPSWVSFSCKDGRHINDGTPIEEASEIFNQHPSVFAIGINCTKPEYVGELIDRIKAVSDKKIVVYPNSSEEYDARTKTWSGSKSHNDFIDYAESWLQNGADLIGGCCRIGPEYIQALASKYST